MTHIGIVGTGISGLTLALRLQQRGVDTTVYSPIPLEELGRGRLPNTVARFGDTLERERTLGLEPFGGPQGVCGHFSMKDAFAYVGYTSRPFEAVDFRLL